MTRCFGSSPLTPASEHSKPAPQMQATRSAGTRTEMTAPAQTKKETSIPISDRASMVKNIRHDDSVAKLVKPFIIGTNQMDQQSRAKEANPASGSTESTSAEEWNAPARDQSVGTKKRLDRRRVDNAT